MSPTPEGAVLGGWMDQEKPWVMQGLGGALRIWLLKSRGAQQKQLARDYRNNSHQQQVSTEK